MLHCISLSRYPANSIFKIRRLKFSEFFKRKETLASHDYFERWNTTNTKMAKSLIPARFADDVILLKRHDGDFTSPTVFVIGTDNEATAKEIIACIKPRYLYFATMPWLTTYNTLFFTMEDAKWTLNYENKVGYDNRISELYQINKDMKEIYNTFNWDKITWDAVVCLHINALYVFNTVHKFSDEEYNSKRFVIVAQKDHVSCIKYNWEMYKRPPSNYDHAKLYFKWVPVLLGANTGLILITKSNTIFSLLT